MPVIPVDQEGHVLFYEESGSPSESNEPYTTLFIVHGSGFHGAIFKRLLPLAGQYNVRLVLVNRREYPGSSPFTDDDLNRLRSEDDSAHIEFAKQRAREIATFVRTFIEKEEVPRASLDGKRGGVALMGWSSGASQTIALLGYADSLPEGLRTRIEPYLRRYIIFDVARSIHGLPAMGNTKSLLQDLSLTPEERAARFCRFTSAYSLHKSVTSRKEEDLQKNPGLDHLTPTIERMSEDELREVTYTHAIERSEVGMRTGSPEILAARVQRALYDDEMTRYLPNCGVDIIYGGHSPWTIIDGVWKFQELKEKADKATVKGRPLRFFLFPKANHFPHWEMPDETMRSFADILMSGAREERVTYRL